MQHQIRAPAERILQPGWTERAVDQQIRAARMRLVGVVLDVKRRAVRVHWRLEQDDVTALQVVGRAVEGELLQAA